MVAPSLFSMMLSVRFIDAFQDRDTRVLIRYRSDGKVFDLRRLQAKSTYYFDDNTLSILL